MPSAGEARRLPNGSEPRAWEPHARRAIYGYARPPGKPNASAVFAVRPFELRMSSRPRLGTVATNSRRTRVRPPLSDLPQADRVPGDSRRSRARGPRTAVEARCCRPGSPAPQRHLHGRCARRGCGGHRLATGRVARRASRGGGCAFRSGLCAADDGASHVRLSDRQWIAFPAADPDRRERATDRSESPRASSVPSLDDPRWPVFELRLLQCVIATAATQQRVSSATFSLPIRCGFVGCCAHQTNAAIERLVLGGMET